VPAKQQVRVSQREGSLKLILVRHGETFWNEEKRVQGGDSDIELNDTGQRQAQRLAFFLKEEPIAAILSSPLRRARETAEAIAGYHHLPVQIDPRLRELKVGQLEGLLLSDCGTTFSHYLMQWWQGSEAARLPQGESLVELQQRVWSVVRELLGRYKDETVVVVSHYFVTLVIILTALDLPLAQFIKFRVDPASISVLEFRDFGARLLTFNDTSY
jgi:probable phosphoglycerate mutase